MAFSAIGTYACRALQQNLIDYYGANTAEMKTMGSKSLLRWMLGPQNTRGFVQITDRLTGLPSAVPGKKRAIAFQLDTPFCFDVCAIEGLTCTTPREQITELTKEVVFDFDGPAYMVCNDDGDPVQLQFDSVDLERYCTETDTAYITRQIARFNRQFIQAFDKRVGEQLATMVGQNALNEAVTSIPFFMTHLSSNMQTINPNAHWYLNKVYSDIGGEAQYALIGGAVVNKIAMYAKWAGLTDAGIDLGEIDDLNPFIFYDRYLDATIGVNNMFLLSPGAVQLVTFNDYVGDSARQVTELYTNGTWVDTDTGLQVDYRWRFDYDCEKWVYEPRLRAQLAVARPGGCGIPNANGVLLIEDCSLGATPPECPAES